jgi:hypothetical protein
MRLLFLLLVATLAVVGNRAEPEEVTTEPEKKTTEALECDPETETACPPYGCCPEPGWACCPFNMSGWFCSPDPEDCLRQEARRRLVGWAK